MNHYIKFAFLCLISFSRPFTYAEDETSSDGNGKEISIQEINNAAHLLAGMDAPHPGNEDLFDTKSFRYHKEELDDDWEEYTEETLQPLREWAATEVAPNSKEGGVLRYMFSGPDILHGYAMFPKVDTYIMCGLEPVGGIPNLETLTPGSVGKALGHVRKALGEVINYSYFITKDMQSELRYVTYRGITPIILVFLARSGLEVQGIEYFELQKDGTLKSHGRKNEDANVVKIDFSPADSEDSKTLYFFSTDLSNESFAPKGFATWMEGHEKGDAYFKAASFLLHSRNFSELRDHLLDHSLQIVGDDSGIEFEHFDLEKWDQHLYGVYNGPINIFKWAYQSDMRSAYKKGAKKLPFGTGYKWRKGQSNLMRHVLKDQAPDEGGASAPADSIAPENKE